MVSPVRIPGFFSTGLRRSKGNDESRDCSSIPTLELDSGSEESGSSSQLSSRSPKKASQEKESSSPKKALTQFRLAPSRSDKRRQEEPPTPKKSLAPIKVAPPKVDKRINFESWTSFSRVSKTTDSQEGDFPRINSDRHMGSTKISSSCPNTPRTPARRQNNVPINAGSPARTTLSTMDDFFSEYAKIMDEFPEKKHKGGKKGSTSVIGW
jgi:hypothetical protein